MKIAIRQIFPFLFSTLWFITCYVLYYLLHGFLNKALNASRDIIPGIAMIVLLLFDIVFFALGVFYYSELVGFIIIHIFTWFLKKQSLTYKNKEKYKLGLRIFIIGIVGWLLGAALMNVVGVRIDAIGSKLHKWNSFINPFILAVAYGLILLASCKEYHSAFINKISSLSLYIYMITGNQLLRIYPDNILYDIVNRKFEGEQKMKVCFIFILIYAFIKLVLGALLAYLYKHSIAKLTNTVIVHECSFLSKQIDKIKVN